MIKKGFVLLLFLLVGVLGGFWVTAPGVGNPEQYEAQANRYKARIVRDAYGVPHIFGERDVDVSFGLAFAHAEDDYATIQDVILATRGKLATLHGPKAAKTDYLIQWMDVWGVVNAGYQSRISQATRNHAEAYADGLNYYISQNPGVVAAGVLPFTGADMIAGFTFKTPLFFGFDQVVAAVAEGEYGTGLDKTANLQITDKPQPELGSQGIAVAPNRTPDGHTRLLVNSHQPLTGPVAWYEARVKSAEGWDMAGGTFPGSPVILHGTGPTLGWANTVNKPDLVDVYQLTLNPENDTQYLLDGQWQDFDITLAEIDVTFWGPIRWTFHEPIYRSAHGPVFKTKKGAFAVRWAGMAEVRTLEEMIALNKARTQDDFEAALSMLAMPSINYVYADKAGNIAHYYNAMLPKRLPDVDWKTIVSGERSDLIWKDYHPFSSIPKTVNPPSGLVYNANNTPFEASVGEGQPEAPEFDVAMGLETHMTNRALRIKELFGADDQISAADMHAYKYDNQYALNSQVAKAVQDILAANFNGTPELVAGQALLAKWDLSTNTDNRGAALGILSTQDIVIARMQNQPSPQPVDSFQKAVKTLMTHFGRLDPDWGELNKLVRGNDNWALAGAPDVLRAVYGEFDEAAGHLEATAGDSYIMFVEWSQTGEQLVRSIHNFGSATLDQSSKHYSDQAGMFAAERERILPLDMVALEAEKTSDRCIGACGN